MWTPILVAYATVLLTLVTAAALVGVFTHDHQRCTRALTILKTLLTTACGSASLFLITVHLDQTGLL